MLEIKEVHFYLNILSTRTNHLNVTLPLLFFP